MAGGNFLQGLGEGLIGVSNTLQNYQQQQQRAQELTQQQQLMSAKLEEAKQQRAANRVDMGLKLETPALRKKYFEGAGREHLKTLFGQDVAEDYVNYIATPIGAQKSKLLFDLVGKDPQEAKKVLQEISKSGAIQDIAVLNDIYDTHINRLQKEASVKKTIAESTSPFADPKFAFKQASDEATFLIKDANDKLKQFRSNLAILQKRNPGATIDQARNQAMADAGINGLSELQKLQTLSSMTPTQYAGMKLKESGQAFTNSNALPQSVTPISAPAQEVSTGQIPPRLPTEPLKILGSPAITQLAEAKTLPILFKDIETTINDQKNADIFGPIAGRKGQINPYDTKAQVVDAQLRTSSQAFGKFMEGGVLRKEDEEKYRRMFPQLTDTPDVQKGKLENVKRLFKIRNQLNEQLLKAGGYDVPQEPGAQAAAASSNAEASVFDDVLPPR